MKTLLKAAKSLMELYSQANDGAGRTDHDRALLGRIEHVLRDSENAINNAERPMTFKEFFASPFATERVWCLLTFSRKVSDTEVATTLALRWNPDNYKWHMPTPFGDFEEVGVYGDVGPIKAYGGVAGRVETVQLIVPNIVLSTTL